MSCGKKPLIKSWDKPRKMRVIKNSPYEQNEASVKLHWKKVVNDMEMAYKDDKFWESQREIVRDLVGPVLFSRMIKIFDLPPDIIEYEPLSESASIVASNEFYVKKRSSVQLSRRQDYSMTEFEPSIEHVEGVEEEEQTEQWSDESHPESNSSKQQVVSQKSLNKVSRGASIIASRNFSRMISSKSFSQRAASAQSVKTKSGKSEIAFSESPAHSYDDMDVQLASIYGIKRGYNKHNPHFDMLFCNESETDMITWESKYKKKSLEVSASDEFSKKAEILTKKIANEFFEWWSNFGSAEFKTEIKRPEDLEDLFQVWFDEHASRSLKLDARILPCVLPSIAGYIHEPQTSCPRVLKRQIAYDIHAETSPAHTRAFNSTLPQNMKHIPPQNNTKNTWHCVKIPQDLRTMSCVWGDILHITSTKAFFKWLKLRPQMSMPPCLVDLDAPGDKKQPFVVPSDFVMRDRTGMHSEDKGLALPVSEYTLELTEVLSKLMNE